MAVTLIVNNQPFEYPTQGTQAPWGESATAWAEEVTKVLNTLKGVSDLLETAASISNNATTPKDITGFQFDPGTVKSFSVNGSVTRVYDSNQIEEQFVLTGLKTATGWKIQQDGIGDAGITLSITAAGQVQYTSTNLSFSTTYSGLMKFRGIAILNA